MASKKCDPLDSKKIKLMEPGNISIMNSDAGLGQNPEAREPTRMSLGDSILLKNLSLTPPFILFGC
jgi:hypothetical protein